MVAAGRMPLTPEPTVGALEQLFTRWAGALTLADVWCVSGFDVVIADDIIGDYLEDFLDLADTGPVHLLDKFWAGAIALGIHNSAYIAEIIRSGFQSVPKGLVEAARSLGMSRERTLRRVQAPLAFRTILPVLGSQFIIAVKDSSLVGFIGLTELFRTAQNTAAATYKPLSSYAIVSVYYLVIVLVLTAVVNRMEKQMGRHKS